MLQASRPVAALCHPWNPLRRTCVVLLGLASLSPAFAATAAPQGLPQNVIEELAAVYPYSAPTATAMTDDGQWLFSAEGGSIAVIDISSAVPVPPTTQGTPNGIHETPAVQDMPAEIKRFQVGSLGVMSAEIAVDPEMQLTPADVTTAPDYSAAEDKYDILYVAGGHLGLWAVDANPNPTPGSPNAAVRLDDSGNRDPSTQDGQRFCTSVATTVIGGEPYLLALFARKNKNVFRAYRLEDARNALAAARTSSAVPPDLSNPISAITHVFFKKHPDQPDDYIDPSTGENLTFNGSYGINFTVDTNPDPGAGPSGIPMPDGSVDVYIAALSGGLLRVRLYPWIPTDPLEPTTLHRDVQWGPIFGTNCRHYADAADDTLRKLNGQVDPVPIEWFENPYHAIFSRSTEFKKETLSDPPYFMDVAVQNDAGGHYLYAAIGHLGWMRFDLSIPFENGMPIDHHEGIPSVKRLNGTPAGAPDTSPEYAFASREIQVPPPGRAGYFEPMVQIEPGIAVGDALAQRNARHAVSIAITRTSESPTDGRSVLIVNYAPLSWIHYPDVKGPGRVLDQSFQEIGHIPFSFYGRQSVESELKPLIVIYDRLRSTDSFVSPYVSSPQGWLPNSTLNPTHYLFMGGDWMFVPDVQPENWLSGWPSDKERIRFAHGDTSFDYSEAKPEKKSSPCLTYVDLLGDVAGVVSHAWIRRGDEQIVGRYAFSTAFADSFKSGDERVVVQAHNDYPVKPSGLVFSDGLETAGGAMGIIETSPPGEVDERLQVDNTVDERSQFLNGADEQWMVGGTTISGEVGGFWYFTKQIYSTGSGGVPQFAAPDRWYLETTEDRHGKPIRPFYMFGMTDPAFDAFTLAQDWLPNDPGNEYHDTVCFMTRSGTADGIEVFARTPLVQKLITTPPIVLPPTGAVGLEDPWDRDAIQVNLRVNTWAFTLASHPEWGNLKAYDWEDTNTTQGPELPRAQQLFDVTPLPPLEANDATNFGSMSGYSVSNRGPLLLETAIMFTFGPRFVQLPSAVAGEGESWVLAAPCGFATCPPALDDEITADSSGAVGGWAQRDDGVIPASYDLLPIGSSAFDPDPYWGTQYRKGVVNLWQMSGTAAHGAADYPIEPWERGSQPMSLTAEVTRTGAPTLPADRPPGSPNLQPLFLEGDGTSAYAVRFAEVTDPTEGPRRLAFVVDFAGTVQVFDVTDLLSVLDPDGYISPLWTWSAEPDVLEGKLPNLFDLAIDDDLPGSAVNVYVAASKGGLQVVPFELPGGFGDTLRIKTPGEVHSCTIENVAGNKLLLVCDASGGYRFYRVP